MNFTSRLFNPQKQPPSQLYRPGLAKPFERPVLKRFINFEEILTRAHGKFKEQNKVLAYSVIIIIIY